jgi:hypothetical protein
MTTSHDDQRIQLSDRMSKSFSLIQQANQEVSTIQAKKLLLQAVSLLNEEKKVLEREWTMLYENAVPGPQGAAQWAEANSRQVFIAEDLKRARTEDDVIRKFDYLFKTNDTVGCYLIWRLAKPKAKFKLFDYVVSAYPDFEKMCEIHTAKDNARSYFIDQALLPVARAQLTGEDMNEIARAVLASD